MRSAAFMTHALLARQMNIASFCVQKETIASVEKEVRRKSVSGYFYEITEVITAAQPGIDDYLPDYIHEVAGETFPCASRAVQLGLNSYVFSYALLEGQGQRAIGRVIEDNLN